MVSMKRRGAIAHEEDTHLERFQDRVYSALAIDAGNFKLMFENKDCKNFTNFMDFTQVTQHSELLFFLMKNRTDIVQNCLLSY